MTIVAHTNGDRPPVAHLVDDLCKANGKLRRQTRQSADLLTDALHALRHGCPHVTDEFLDRTIANLLRVLKETEGMS